MAVKNKNTFSYSSSIVCETTNLQCCMPLLDDLISIQHHQTYLSYHMRSCSYCFGETWEGTGCRRCLVEGCSIGPDCWEGECNFFFSPPCIFPPFPARKSILGNPIKESIDSKKEATFDAFFAGFGRKAHIIVGADQQPNNQTNQSHGNLILFLQHCSWKIQYIFKFSYPVQNVSDSEASECSWRWWLSALVCMYVIIKLWMIQWLWFCI